MFLSHTRRRALFAGTASLSIAALAMLTSAALLAAPADKGKPPAAGKAAVAVKKSAPLSQDDRIVHVLNRLGYGPRPGDVEKVRAIGIERYVDDQLNPDRIPDSAVESKLSAFTELNLGDSELYAAYNELLQGSKTMQALRRKQNKKSAQAGGQPDMLAGAAATPGQTDPDAARAKRLARRQGMDPEMRREAMEARQEMVKAATPVARAHEEFMAAKALRAIESERQLQEVLVDFWGNHFNIDIRRSPCGVLKIIDDREAIRPHVFGKFRELLGASAKSPAMLVYLDNFQSMSENVPAAPARRAANQRRRARLAQQAQAGTAAPGTAAPGTVAPGAATPVAPPKPKQKRPSGLNENYAREIMELHTLGVDGGYTQQDVREVARCLTGWSVDSGNARRPANGKYAAASGFRFYPAMHDNGEKTVLGHVIPAGGGQQDGERVLDILASHPATMRHISTQLCQRLVADDPPASLVNKCVETWKRTDGDLREIVRTIATSPEFYAPAAVRTKIKSPFEYAVSSVRALGGTYQSESPAGRNQPRQAAYLIKPPKGGGYLDIGTTSLIGQVGTMGQPLFQYQAPTGYPEDSRKWVSSGALISRLNFALALTNGNLGDVKVPGDAAASASDPARTIDHEAAQILHVNVSAATRATLLKQVSEPASATSSGIAAGANRVAALLLGSPEFQRH